MGLALLFAPRCFRQAQAFFSLELGFANRVVGAWPCISQGRLALPRAALATLATVAALSAAMPVAATASLLFAFAFRPRR